MWGGRGDWASGARRAEGLLFFNRALQWVLVLAGEVHHLGDLGFGDLVGENTAHPNPAAVHVHHDVGGFLAGFLKEAFQHVNDEFHRRVVVVQH